MRMISFEKDFFLKRISFETDFVGEGFDLRRKRSRMISFEKETFEKDFF